LSREEIISCVLLFGKTTEVLKLSRSWWKFSGWYENLMSKIYVLYLYWSISSKSSIAIEVDVQMI
jgi:hypothetical protein